MSGQILKIDDLDEATQTSMYALFAKQFSGVTMAEFRHDLADKNWVLLLRDDDGRLNGFSTIHYYEETIDGCLYPIVFSGDTVVDVDSWSDSALSYWWMGAIDYLRRLHGKERLFWFIIVSGFRTYRFLPVYSKHFFPRYDAPTPAATQAVMDYLATQRFGERYDPVTGIVRLATPSMLKGKLSGIPENRLSDPHVAFFAERNPNHMQGDELVCFAELSEDSLTRLGQRMWKKGRKLVETMSGES